MEDEEEVVAMVDRLKIGKRNDRGVIWDTNTFSTMELVRAREV